MKLRSVLLCLPLFVLLSGCDGGASYDDPKNPRPSPIVGRWQVRSYYTPTDGLKQCPSSSAVFDCTNPVRYTFNSDGSMVDPDGTVRTYRYNGTVLTYFGQPAGLSITIGQFTENLATAQLTYAGRAEPLQLLLEKQ